ncbi:hypothetical protein KRM28CT15_26800 [Krasilnikovia sp. M28-CT-15]
MSSRKPRIRPLGSNLRYAASGGQDLDGKLRDTPALSPFDFSVRDQLVAAGIDASCQWAVGGYRTDFAANTSANPDAWSSPSKPTARPTIPPKPPARDRLRQNNFERLGRRFHRI